MPKFKMTYTYPRFWPGLGLHCAAGEVIERDANPDPIHFEEVDPSTPVGLPKPEEAEPDPDPEPEKTPPGRRPKATPEPDKEN